MKTLDELLADKIIDLVNYGLSKIIKPDIEVEKVTDLDAKMIDELKEKYGIEGVILDVDETLRKDMKRIPDAIFVVDPKKERICIKEAQALGITLIGIADTNCDPEELDYVIPGNDDAIRAVKLIVSKMADAVIEAQQGVDADSVDEAEAEEAAEE